MYYPLVVILLQDNIMVKEQENNIYLINFIEDVQRKPKKRGSSGI